MDKIYFREEQKFGQWWLWLLLAGATFAVILPFTNGIYTQLILGKPWGDNPVSDEALLIIAGFSVSIMLIILWFFLKMKLITEVRSDGLWFRYPPLVPKWNCIRKEDIERYEIRHYKPMLEYGGYGVRQGTRKYGKAYNVQGNIGLQIYLTNGKKMLIGTTKKQALKYAMDRMAEG